MLNKSPEYLKKYSNFAEVHKYAVNNKCENVIKFLEKDYRRNTLRLKFNTWKEKMKEIFYNFVQSFKENVETEMTHELDKNVDINGDNRTADRELPNQIERNVRRNVQSSVQQQTGIGENQSTHCFHI